MEDNTMNRSWKVAALASVAGAAFLVFGLFLAVGKESMAGDKVQVTESTDGPNVRVVRVVGEGDSEVPTIMQVLADGDPDSATVVKVRTGNAGDAEMAAAIDEVSRSGYLGVAVREDTKGNEGGAFVDNVIDGSPADKAGLKDGDVIVGFGGVVIRGPGKLTEQLRGTKPGDKVTMDVTRDGKPVKLQVEMGDRPKPKMWAWRSGDAALSEEQRLALEDSLRGLDELPQLKELGKLNKMKFYGPGNHRLMIFGADKPLLGVEMIETTPELRDALGGSKDAGVLVGKVLPGTAAEKAGIRVGDLILSVDGTKVVDPGDLAETVREHEGKTVDIDLVRDKKPVRVKAGLPKIDEQDDPPTGPRASSWGIPHAALGHVASFLARLAT